MPTFIHNGDQYHYGDTGSGKVLVLLHGLGCQGDHWQPQIDAFSPHYRVITPDSRGHGRSHCNRGPSSVKQLADDVLILLNHLTIKQVDIIGYSMGGMVGFELACHHAERLNSLTVINSTPHMPANNNAVRYLYWSRTLAIRCLGITRQAKKVSRHLFPQPKQYALAQQYFSSMGSMKPSLYLAALRAITRWSVLDLISSIKLPTLVVTGDRDYTTVASKKAYCDLIPKAELHVINNSNHATPMNQPDALNKVLLTFIKKVDSRS